MRLCGLRNWHRIAGSIFHLIPSPAPLPPVNFASERIAAAQVVKDIADVWATSILYVPPVPFLDAVNREIHAVATDAHTMAVAAKAAADSAQEAAEEAESMARQCTSTGTAAGGAREVGRAARFGPHDGCHQFVACFRFSWTETFRLISTWSRSPAKYCYCALHPGSIQSETDHFLNDDPPPYCIRALRCIDPRS